MSHSSVDRRRAQRVDAKLNLELQLPVANGHSVLETINVSSAGLYFRSPRYIEPMTKLAMSFDVPMRSGGQKSVSCEGIVARITPEAPAADTDSFEVAVFFTDIDNQSRKNLTAYIEQGLVHS